MAFENFPYTDFHNLNLDWIFKKMADLVKEWVSFRDNMDAWKSDTEKAFDDLQAYVENYFENLDLSNEIKTIIESMIQTGAFEAIIRSIINQYADEMINNRVSNQWLLENRPKYKDFIGGTVSIYRGDAAKVQRDSALIKSAGINRLRTDVWWDEIANYSGSSGYPLLGYQGTLDATKQLYNMGFALDINITCNQKMTSGESKFPSTRSEITSFLNTCRRFITALKNANILNVRFELWNEPETFGVTAAEYLNCASQFYAMVKSVYDYPVVVGNTSYIPNALIQAYLDGGISNFCDFFNVHPYTGNDFTANPVTINNRLSELKIQLESLPVIAGEYGFSSDLSVRKDYYLKQTFELMKHDFDSVSMFSLYFKGYNVISDDGSSNILDAFAVLYDKLKDTVYVQPFEDMGCTILQFLKPDDTFVYVGWADAATDYHGIDIGDVPSIVAIPENVNIFSNSYDKVFIDFSRLKNEVLRASGQLNGSIDVSDIHNVKNNSIWTYFSQPKNSPVPYSRTDFGTLVSFASAEYITHLIYSETTKNMYVEFSSDFGTTWRGYHTLYTFKSDHILNTNADSLTENRFSGFSGGLQNSMDGLTNDFGIAKVQKCDGTYPYTEQTFVSAMSDTVYKRISTDGSSWRNWFRLMSDHGSHIANIDCNSIKKSGVYTFSGGAQNAPQTTTNDYGILIVIDPVFRQYKLQIFVSGATNKVGLRFSTDSFATFRNWFLLN